MPATTAKQLQIGQEVTWGTGVAATARLMAVTDYSFDVADTVEVVDELGKFNPGLMAAITNHHGEASITAVATYEDIMYFANSLYGAGTSSGTYTWAYAAPLTTAPVAKAYTIEFGAASGAPYEMEGSLVTALTLSGEAGGMWQMQANLIGEQVLTSTHTTSLADRTVNIITAAQTALYMDTWGGTMGTTAVTATLISFNCEINSNRHLKQFAGTIMSGGWGEGKWSGTLSLVLEFNATAKAIVDAMVAATPAMVQRQIKLLATDTAARTCALEFCGTKSSGTTLFSDRDGNVTVELTFQGTYHTTYANWHKLIVTNAVSALP